MTIDGSFVYWTEQNVGVKKVPKSGKTPTTLANRIETPAGITVDDTHVYWGEASSLRKVPKG